MSVKRLEQFIFNVGRLNLIASFIAGRFPFWRDNHVWLDVRSLVKRVIQKTYNLGSDAEVLFTVKCE